MSTHPAPHGGPSLPQHRNLVTEIPGPMSRELFERRQRSVARGLSHVLPVFVTAAGGGVVVDVDGNSLIDFGSGIAVDFLGNAYVIGNTAANYSSPFGPSPSHVFVQNSVHRESFFIRCC